MKSLMFGKAFGHHVLLLVPLAGRGGVGEKIGNHGIDFRLGAREDCEPCGGLSHESFAPAP